MTNLLEVSGLRVAFPGETGPVTVIDDLDLTLASGQTLALVGESGSGKSVTALAITRLIDFAGGRITAGRIAFTDGQGQMRDLATEPPRPCAPCAVRKSPWCFRSR